MKNNELTEVKSSIPSLEGLSQEVIEYVHGLVAENEEQQTLGEALAIDNSELREVVQRMMNQFAMSGISPVENSLNPASALMFDAERALFMPATDAAIAELRAQGVDELINSIMNETGLSSDWPMEELRAFAANLRAGRKG